jgi:hypothetical protein
MISAQGVPSPHLRNVPSEQEIYDSLGGANDGDSSLHVAETARRRTADRVRRELSKTAGRAIECTDSEAIDAIQYFVFPNFVPWGGYAPIVYRFRPNGNDPESCKMELMLLTPTPADSTPVPIVPIELDYGESWSTVPGLGRLAEIFDQDMTNLDVIQRGVRASRKGAITLAAYQESRIRHFEETLDSYLSDQLSDGTPV